MTILETLIKLRDDIKLWVTNNLNQKADISYVDEKIAAIPEFDPKDLNDRIDVVEDDIYAVSQTLNGVSQELENYKNTNNEAVSTNANGIAVNKAAIEEIQSDYLISSDKTQLQDNITQLAERVTTNESAIETLNGEGEGSVKQSIDNAVDTINTSIEEIQTDLSNYQIETSDHFTELDTIINNHTADTNNPHDVTKEQIGLGNVDNTSDYEKPISYAVEQALEGKADFEHEHNILYYTKDEILDFITVEDIDNICGMVVDNTSKGLTYALNSDGTGYAVTKIGTCTDTNVVIPNEYDGLPVTEIGTAAFYNNTELVSVVIPDSVTTLQQNAFGRCSNLTSVVIPDSVSYIGMSAFINCTSLTSITLPDSITTIDVGAFQGCNNLAFINLPDGITSIAPSIFDNCTRLTSIIIPNNVTKILANAFYKCTSLSSIHLHEGITTVNVTAFGGCTNLTNIYVDWFRDQIPNAPWGATNAIVHYWSTDLSYSRNYNGNEYAVSRIGTCTDTVVRIPKEYNGLPVTEIYDGAFYDCINLISVIIPNSVTMIGDCMCEGCINLTSVTIPDSVTEIGGAVFAYCDNLSINYTGTEEQWNAIDFASDWNVDIGDYTINYNYVE